MTRLDALRERFDPLVVAAFARKEIRDALRNRWFVLYAVAFAVLATALSLLSMAGTATFGYAGYGRTAASLINLTILFVPLMGLSAGAAAIAPERESGTLRYLLAQPVRRVELLAGKFLGLAVALLGALALGFGTSAALLAARQPVDAGALAGMVGMAAVLAMGMLGVGLLLSTIARRGGVALGAALVLWLALVFVGDLGLMGSALVFDLQIDTLMTLALANPLQVFKMAALQSVQASLDVLGPAGLYARRTWGDSVGLIFGAVLAAWVAVPLAASWVVLRLRGDV